MLETDQVSAGIDGLREDLETNPDGSVTVHFSAEPPAGAENNWVQTIAGKGFNVIFRVYGPTEPWLNGSWKPGDFQKVR